MSEEDDILHPHALALAQAYFEYRSILSQEVHGDATGATKNCWRDQAREGGQRILPSPTQSTQGEIEEKDEEDGKGGDEEKEILDLQEKKNQHQRDQQDEPAFVRSAKRLKLPGETTRKHPPELGARSRSRVSPTTSLKTLRVAAREGTGEVVKNNLRDIFVLVVQNSGLHLVSSRTGHDVGVTTLLVADPTSSLLRVTLWKRAAKVGAELIKAGDLVRINRISVSTFRGTVQAKSTFASSFRVVWRNDTFTNAQDAPRMSMHPPTVMYPEPGSPQGSGGKPCRGEDMEVPREAACDLASWAKRDFPSVTRSSLSVETRAHPRASQHGSLASVRQGVEISVRACVAEVSDLERIWTWDFSGGASWCLL